MVEVNQLLPFDMLPLCEWWTTTFHWCWSSTHQYKMYYYSNSDDNNEFVYLDLRLTWNCYQKFFSFKWNEIENGFPIEARLGFESPLSHLTSEVIPPFKCQGNKKF